MREGELETFATRMVYTSQAKFLPWPLRVSERFGGGRRHDADASACHAHARLHSHHMLKPCRARERFCVVSAFFVLNYLFMWDESLYVCTFGKAVLDHVFLPRYTASHHCNCSKGWCSKNTPSVVKADAVTMWERQERQLQTCSLVWHIAGCEVKKFNNKHTLHLRVLRFLSTFILIFKQQIAQISRIVSNNSCCVKNYFDVPKIIPYRVHHLHLVAAHAHKMKGGQHSVRHFTSFQGA